MKIEFEKQFGKGTDPWYAKAERWAKKKKVPYIFSCVRTYCISQKSMGQC